MRVFISGITGFVGSRLASNLIWGGHDVFGSSTTGTHSTFTTVRYRLGDRFDGRLLAGTDAIIHCAHDLAAGSGALNVAGTTAIAEAGRARGVGKQIFISSYSAHSNAVTEYGRTKLELQEFFLKRGWEVAQPGLVVGPGGLFRTMVDVVRTRRVVPIVYPNALVPVLAIRDLELAIAKMIKEPTSSRLARLYIEPRVSMADLIREIRLYLKSRALIVPIPYGAALAALDLIEAVGMQAPLSRDNLLALHANQSVTEPGDLTDYVLRPMPLGAMIDAAV